MGGAFLHAADGGCLATPFHLRHGSRDAGSMGRASGTFIGRPASRRGRSAMIGAVADVTRVEWREARHARRDFMARSVLDFAACALV
jgi:hypothetical protein